MTFAVPSRLARGLVAGALVLASLAHAATKPQPKKSGQAHAAVKKAPVKKAPAKPVAHELSGKSRSKKPDQRAPGPAALSKGRSAKPEKGKPTRIPRTQRTVPVSPAVRETSAERVQRHLAETGAAPFAFPTALNPFFAALADQQTDRAVNVPPTRTVRILQFGDSHTAADLFTGELRARFQTQFGDGGLGFQFPGHPFAGYHIVDSLRSQTVGWTTEGNHFTALGSGDLGLGGLSIATSLPGQAITLQVPACDTLQLHFLRQPGGGHLQFTDNGTPISIVPTATEIDAAAPPSSVSQDSPSRAGTFAYACAAGAHAFEFTTLDAAPVKLLGILTEQPGVTYECLGINGAVAPLILRWNQALFTEYLRQRAPALIVLAYGTNEAGESADHAAAYPADFAQVVDTLHRAVPAAAVLVLGPADRAVASGRGRHMAWHTLSGVDRIAAMQRQVCRVHNCAFWDTRLRMGGTGAMLQWVAAGYAQPDRTHLTGTGYHALADALYADLFHLYNSYQQHAAVQP